MKPTFSTFFFLLSSLFVETVVAAEQSSFELSTAVSFNPRSFPKSVATCKAVNRAEGEETEISIHYVDTDPGSIKETLILVHGWPSLWASWSYQIMEFKSDYRLIAPDHRGFGSSTHPGDVESSGMMGDLVGDLTCVLDHAGVSSAICVGHDWGSQVCWEAGRMRPDIFTAIAGIVVPYIPSAGDHFVPTADLAKMLPRLAYQQFFEKQTEAAALELNRDIRRTLRGTLRTVDSPPPEAFLTSEETFIGSWDDIPVIPPIPFFTSDEEDYWVEQYFIQGFDNTLQFYTHGNRFGSWKFDRSQGNYTIPQPALSVYPTEDPVADWAKAAQLLQSDKFIPQLTTETIVAAHWPQLEAPAEFNAILRRWLRSLGKHEGVSGGSAESDQVNERRIVDEL